MKYLVETNRFNGVMYDWVHYFPSTTRFLIVSNFKKQLFIHDAYFKGGDGPDLSVLKSLVSYPENLKGWAKGKGPGFGNMLWLPMWYDYFDKHHVSESVPLTICFSYDEGPRKCKKWALRPERSVLIGYWAPDYE